MRLIVYTGILFLLAGCAQTVKKENLHLLNGYWEITRVVFSDGNKKEYTVSTSVDYIEIKGDTGFRKKVQPKLDGTFDTSDDAETFFMLATENGFEFSYKNAMSEWKERLIGLTEDEFSLENESGIQYDYKRFSTHKYQRLMAKRKSTGVPLSDALDQFIKKNKLQKGMDKVNAREAWANLMGNGVNNYTTAIELRGETLFVSLSSSVLREELNLGKSKIIVMLNEELGKDLVKKLILR